MVTPCETIPQKIERISREENFDVKTALRIAKCESTTGLNKVNFEGSSAYGLYQFMPKTWEHYCEGSIENDSDQIYCFIKLYPLHPSWWECK